MSVHRYSCRWDRSFAPPLQVTVDLTDAACPTVTVWGDRSRLGKTDQRAIGDALAESFLRHLARHDFWNQPEEEPEFFPMRLDRIGWTLFGERDGETHRIVRLFPNTEDPVYALVLGFADIGNIYREPML